METKDIINDLQKSIDAYKFFFAEWLETRECPLTKDDKLIIDLCIRNELTIINDEKVMLMERLYNIEVLVKKLKETYKHYKMWAVLNCFSEVIPIAQEYGFDKFFASPISSLIIDSDIKTELEKLNVKTASQIFKCVSQRKIEDETFYGLMRLQRVLKKRNQIRMLEKGDSISGKINY